MPLPLEQLRRLGLDRLNVIRQDAPVDLKIKTPENVKATGKEGYIRIQWSPNLEACDGYQIAISTTNNIQDPDIGLKSELGIKANYFDYNCGNAALTRSFAVRAFQGFPPRFFSDFSPVVSATSIATTAVGGAEPVAPSPVPSTRETPPAGERTGVGRYGVPR